MQRASSEYSTTRNTGHEYPSFHLIPSNLSAPNLYLLSHFDLPLYLVRPLALPSYLSRSFSPYREISDKENEPVPLFAREQISGIARSWTTTWLEMELLHPGTRLPLKRYIYIVHACVLIDKCIGKRDTGTLSLLVACHGKLCKLAGVHSTHRLKREPRSTQRNGI